MIIGPTIVYGNSQQKRREKITDIIEKIDPKINTKHPDLFEVSKISKESIGIDQIRKLLSFMETKPYASSYKIAVIYNADKLTTQAQNALLKTLEEPPEYGLILLSTKKVESLLPTIISRCRQVKTTDVFPLMENEGIVYIDNFFSMNIEQKMDFAENLSKKDKEEIVQQLEFFVWQIRNILLDNPDKYYVYIINNIMEVTKSIAETNVNKRLALEALFLKIS